MAAAPAAAVFVAPACGGLLLRTFFRLNSLTRASSGVMVAHLMPTWYSCEWKGQEGGRVQCRA